MRNSSQSITRALYVRKPFLWIFLLFVPILASSCSLPPWENAPEKNIAGICECEDGSGKTWPKWQACGEVVEEEIGRQGYYGELQKTKRTAYFAANCSK